MIADIAVIIATSLACTIAVGHIARRDKLDLTIRELASIMFGAITLFALLYVGLLVTP